MVDTIRKYKIFIIIGILLAITGILFLYSFKQSSKKVHTRGTYVIDLVNDDVHFIQSKRQKFVQNSTYK